MGMPGRDFSGLSGVCGAKSTIDLDGYGRITPTMALKFLSLAAFAADAVPAFTRPGTDPERWKTRV